MNKLPLRDDLVGRQPYGAPQLAVPVRLNVNENPFSPSPKLIADIAAAVADAASTLNRYPDREATLLRAGLAAFVSAETGVEVDASLIWPANGSNEVMLHLLQAFGGPNHRVLSFTPGYLMYPDYCLDTFTEFVTAPRAEDFSLSAEAVVDAITQYSPSVVLLGSPNNPTGTVLPEAVLAAALAVAPGLVVVDEAYAEFRTPGTPSAVAQLSSNANLVVTRTMSKAFACAGLRLGYAIAHPEVLDAIRLVRLPYHLSSVSQATALAALRHADELLANVALLRAERDALADWLVDHGFMVSPSGGNFLLFGQFANRHEIWQRILDHGVLIRETGPESWLRVSIGTPQENERFKTALLASV